jgi:hypothetical protein
MWGRSGTSVQRCSDTSPGIANAADLIYEAYQADIRGEA